MPSLDRSRVTSCSRLISREKMATVLPVALAAARAMFKPMLVLPMPGREAIRTRSELFSPMIRRSRSRRPVVIPGMVFPEAASSDRWEYTLCTT